MTVAGDDLRGEGIRLESEPLARDPLDLRLHLCVRADGSRELPDACLLEGARQPLARPVELERPAGELPSERDRLGVDAVRAADANGRAVLLCAADDGLQCVLDSLEHEGSRGTDLERE